MKYYVIEITNYNDGTKEAYGIYTFTDKTLALSSYHTKMGGALKNEKVASEQIIILNSANGIEVSDIFVRETTASTDTETTTE